MSISSLMQAYYELCSGKEEPKVLRLSPVMYAWFRDRVRELARDRDDYTVQPDLFMGATVVMDKNIDGYRFEMSA